MSGNADRGCPHSSRSAFLAREHARIAGIPNDHVGRFPVPCVRTSGGAFAFAAVDLGATASAPETAVHAAATIGAIQIRILTDRAVRAVDVACVGVGTVDGCAPAPIPGRRRRWCLAIDLAGEPFGAVDRLLPAARVPSAVHDARVVHAAARAHAGVTDSTRWIRPLTAGVRSAASARTPAAHARTPAASTRAPTASAGTPAAHTRAPTASAGAPTASARAAGAPASSADTSSTPAASRFASAPGIASAT